MTVRIVQREWIPLLILVGVSHGDENLLLFDMGYVFNVKPGDTDYKMSEAMVKLWTDFAASPYGYGT